MTFDEWIKTIDGCHAISLAHWKAREGLQLAFETGQKNPDKQVLHKFRDICVGDGRAQTFEEKWDMANETP